METHNIREAKANFSRLVEGVRHGEAIVIGKAGDPATKLAPFESGSAPRRGGQWRGRVRVADDFDHLPADLSAAFGVTDD